jgi:hypothetical protein
MKRMQYCRYFIAFRRYFVRPSVQLALSMWYFKTTISLLQKNQTISYLFIP